MHIIEFALEHSIEIFFAFYFAIGAKWGGAFLDKTDFNDKTEQLVDFVLVCQGWIVAPALLISTCVAGHGMSRNNGAFISFAIVVAALGLFRLLSWKRTGFFCQIKAIRLFFKVMPVVLLVTKLIFEAVYPQSQVSLVPHN